MKRCLGHKRNGYLYSDLQRMEKETIEALHLLLQWMILMEEILFMIIAITLLRSMPLPSYINKTFFKLRVNFYSGYAM